MGTSTPQPALDWEGVEEALIEWASGATGLEAIFANEDGPQPDRPYVVLDWLTPPATVGDDYFKDTERPITKEVERELQGVREAVLTVRVDAASTRAGENALYYCDLLTGSLIDDLIIARLFMPNRMAPWDWQGPKPLPAFEDNAKSVSRASFDLKLGFSAGTGATSQRTGYITKVSLTGSVAESSTIALTAAVTS